MHMKLNIEQGWACPNSLCLFEVRTHMHFMWHIHTYTMALLRLSSLFHSFATHKEAKTAGHWRYQAKGSSDPGVYQSILASTQGPIQSESIVERCGLTPRGNFGRYGQQPWIM